MCDCPDARDPRSTPPRDLELEDLADRHLDEVLAIEHEAFGNPWRREHFEFEIHANRFATNRVALVAGRVVGYTCAWRIAGELKINNVAVHRAWRGRGLGRRLLERVLAEGARAGCTVAHLEVRRSNERARTLYRDLGFVETGRRERYYEREGEDAILMERPLAPPR